MFLSKSTIKETMESLRELTETPGASAAACAGAIGAGPEEDRIPADDVAAGASDPNDLYITFHTQQSF